MKKSTKILLVFALLSVLVMGGGLFYLKQRLDPNKLKSDIIINVEKNYPNLQLKIGKVDLNFGLTTNIELGDISLSNKGEKIPSELLALNKGTVKLPIFNILTGGGTIKLLIEKPFINFIEKEDINNWTEALEKKEFKSLNLGEKKSTDENTAQLPTYLATSQINAQFKDVIVNHLKGEEKNKISFDQIQFKDIGVKRPMAFKLDSAITLGSKKKISFNLNTIGELSLRAFLEDKIIQANSVSKIRNLKVDERPLLEEELVADAAILFRKDKTGRLDIELKSENLLKNKMQVFLLKEETRIEIETMEVFIESLLKQGEIKLSGVGLNDSWLDISGTALISKDGKIDPDLKIKPTKTLSYNLDGNFISLDRLILSLKEDQIGVDASINAFKGRVDIAVGNTIDINSPIDMEKLDIFKISVVANGLEIKKGLFPSKEKTETESKEDKKGFFAPFHLNLEYKNIMLFNEVIGGTGEVIGTSNELAVKSLIVKHGDGQIQIDATSKDFQESPRHKFNVETKNLNAQLFNSFLEKETPQMTGIINASVVGKAVSLKNGIDYDVFIKGSSKKGELVNFDLSSMINGYIEKANALPYLKKKPLKPVKIPQDYETISFDIHAKTKKSKVKKLNFVGVDKKIEVRSQGHIAMKGNSEMYLNFFDSKKNYLKFLKEVDMRHFPVRLEGQGIDLKPDYEFTIKKIIKNGEKRLKRKAKEAAKKAVKKEAEKLKKKLLEDEKLKKKAKDLLKGIL